MTHSLKAPGFVSTLESLECDILVFTSLCFFKRNLCRYSEGLERELTSLREGVERDLAAAAGMGLSLAHNRPLTL
jgi:hypothetical protein